MIKIFKVTGRIVKMAAGAVSVGGWATGLLDPLTAAVIGGVCYFIGDGIVLAGDLVDDGKVNGSFSLDETPS
jgi:hypothetical protein